MWIGFDPNSRALRTKQEFSLISEISLFSQSTCAYLLGYLVCLFLFVCSTQFTLSLVLLSLSDFFHHAFKTHIYTLFFFPFSLSYLYTQGSSYYKYPFITLAVILSLQPFPVGLIKLTRRNLFSFEVSQLLKSLPAIHHFYKIKNKKK